MLRGIRNMKSLPNGRLFVSQGSPCRGAGSRRLTERVSQICSNLSVSAVPSHLPWKGRLWTSASYGFPYEGKALKRKASRVGGFFLYLPEIPMQDGGEVGAGGGGLGIQGAVGAG